MHSHGAPSRAIAGRVAAMVPGRLVAMVVAIALALVAVGCGSSPAEPSKVASTSDDGSASAEAADPGDSEAASSAEDGDKPDSDETGTGTDGNEQTMAAASPIGAYFAEDGGFETALAEYRTRVEEEIVRCMAEQGFEFEVSGESGDNPVQDLQNEMSERAWTTEYGYGISTSFDSVIANQTTDPNAAILFSLSAAEREIWLETMFGPDQQGFTPDLGGRPLEQQGCIGESIMATGGQGAIEGLDGFGNAYEEGRKAIFDLDETIVAVQDWATCMSESGYPGHSDLDAPENDIGERFAEITAPIRSALDEIDSDQARALFSGEAVDAESLPGLDIEALRTLQDEELRVAIADLDCYDGHVREIYEPLRDDFERGLMSDFADQLDALRNIGG